MTTTPLRRRRSVLAAITVALVFAGASCSASGDDDAKDDAPTTTAAEAPTTTSEVEDEPADDTTTTTEDDTDPGGEFGDMSRDEIIEAIADGMLDDGSVPNLDQETAECLAGELLDIVGEDELAEIGMSGGFSGIDEAAATEFAEAWGPCGYDLEGFFLSTMTDNGATDEQAQCVLDQVGIEPIEQLLALGFAGDTGGSAMADIQEQIGAAAQNCR